MSLLRLDREQGLDYDVLYLRLQLFNIMAFSLEELKHDNQIDVGHYRIEFLEALLEFTFGIGCELFGVFVDSVVCEVYEQV
jgi:hypothetical protein